MYVIQTQMTVDRGHLWDILEEILSVALLSPACYVCCLTHNIISYGEKGSCPMMLN